MEEENNNNKELDKEEEEILIRSYRKLLSEIDQRAEELKNPENKEVVGYMHQTQKLFKQIKSPRPLVLDAKITKRVREGSLH